MKDLINQILQGESFVGRPPVCVDIGASGALPREWRALAPHSICVAFDADARDFRAEDSFTNGWKRLVKLNRLVAEKSSEGVDFFLTSSPHCSSRLQPNLAALQAWEFSELFTVDRQVILPAISLTQALDGVGIDYIDWFKTDSQGTDLRIFASLSKEIIDGILVADFEPGILDAYYGEDKLYSLMEFMSTRPFFISDLDVKGTQRIERDALSSLGQVDRKLIGRLLKKSPGWAEVSYLNSFVQENYSKRALLLGWIVSSIKEQHGHALFIAEKGMRQNGDSLFERCRQRSVTALRRRYPHVAWRAAKSIVARLLPK